jgi:hypothetical protein
MTVFAGRTPLPLPRRTCGTSSRPVLQAFGHFVLHQRGLLTQQDPEARERLTELTRTITESPALLARERDIFERYTRSLATLIAKETGAADDVEAWVAANALIDVHRAFLDHAPPTNPRRHTQRSNQPRATRPRQAGLAALEQGLGLYAVR